MAISEERARQIAAEVNAYITAQRETKRASRRIIVPDHVRPAGHLEDAKRDAMVRRIRFLSERYGLRWLIDQVTDGGEPDALGDEALLSLGRDFERALKCIQENVSFLDAGLLRCVGD